MTRHTRKTKINPKKKSYVLKMMRKWRRLLHLKEYSVINRWKSWRDASEVRGNHACMFVDRERKTITIFWNTCGFNELTYATLEEIVVHELVHYFHWEISEFFVARLEKYDVPCSPTKIEDIEHRMVHKLIAIMLDLAGEQP